MARVHRDTGPNWVHTVLCHDRVAHVPPVSEPPPPPPKAPNRLLAFCVGDSLLCLQMSTMVGVGIATGAAKRRRERRLRQWQRHERMTVAMALAEATHHAAPQGGGGERDARRPTGTEVSGHPAGARAAANRPHRAALRRGRPPDPWPAGTDWGVLERQFFPPRSPSSSDVLLRRGRERRRRRRGRRRRRRRRRISSSRRGDPWRAQHLADMKAMQMRRSGIPSSASSSSKRKRKKRSKRKLFKATVPLSLFFFWCAVFPSVDDRPLMLGIKAGTDQKDFSACARLGLLVFDDVPRAVLLCPSSWPAWTTGQLRGGSQVQFLDKVLYMLVGVL